MRNFSPAAAQKSEGEEEKLFFVVLGRLGVGKRRWKSEEKERERKAERAVVQGTEISAYPSFPAFT